MSFSFLGAECLWPTISLEEWHRAVDWARDSVAYEETLRDCRLLWRRSINPLGARAEYVCGGAFKPKADDPWPIMPELMVIHGAQIYYGLPEAYQFGFEFVGRAQAPIPWQSPVENGAAWFDGPFSTWDADTDSEGPGDLDFGEAVLPLLSEAINSRNRAMYVAAYKAVSWLRVPLNDPPFITAEGREIIQEIGSPLMTPTEQLEFFGIAFLGLHQRTGAHLLPGACFMLGELPT